MKKYFLSALLIGILLPSFPQEASATLVTYTGSELITNSGQLFTWTEVVDTSAGIGELIVEAAGDFNYSGSESSNIYLDDIFSAEGLGLSNADFIQEDSPNGHYWKKTFALSSTIMSLLTIDNLIAVQIVNSGPVNPIWDDGFVSWSLTYNSAASVPDASVMLLLGSSLMGLVVFSRRSKRS